MDCLCDLPMDMARGSMDSKVAQQMLQVPVSFGHFKVSLLLLILKLSSIRTQSSVTVMSEREERMQIIWNLVYQKLIYIHWFTTAVTLTQQDCLIKHNTTLNAKAIATCYYIHAFCTWKSWTYEYHARTIRTVKHQTKLTTRVLHVMFTLLLCRHYLHLFQAFHSIQFNYASLVLIKLMLHMNSTSW